MTDYEKKTDFIVAQLLTNAGLCFHGKLYEAQGNGDAEKVCGKNRGIIYNNSETTIGKTRKTTALELLKKSLMQQLLTGKVRVK